MAFTTVDIFLIVLSVGGIFLIILRKVPELAALSEEVSDPVKPQNKNSIIEDIKIFGAKSFLKLKVKVEYRKSIIRFVNFLEKILRKLRLHVLKLDSIFYKWILMLRENNQVHTKNLAVEKGNLFECQVDKIKEAAQKWQNQARQMLEGGMNKSMILMKSGDKRKRSKMAGSEIVFSEPRPQPQPEIIPEEEKIYLERIARNPRDVESYRMLGMIYLGQKNYNDALSSFTEILKLQPDDSHAKHMLLKVTQQLGKG